MNDVIYWLWLSTSPHIGPRAITSLLKYYGSPKEMYFAPVGEITRLLPRNIEVLQTKVNRKNEKSPAKFTRPKMGITKQAGEKSHRQPG